jgi:hypothetical protein
MPTPTWQRTAVPPQNRGTGYGTWRKARYLMKKVHWLLLGLLAFYAGPQACRQEINMFAAVPELGRPFASLPSNVEDRMTEHVYKALDAKPKLPCWDGTSGWRDYEQKMWRVARAIGIEREVRLAANGGIMELDSDEHLAQSRIWFYIVRDSAEPASMARAIVDTAVESNGFEAWQRLAEHFRPKLGFS